MDHTPNTRVRPRGRAHPRYNLGLVARLLTDSNVLICSAKVHDMSGGGAKLILSDQIDNLPRQFDIVLCSASGPRRKCAVVWQSGKIVGVKFLQSPLN